MNINKMTPGLDPELPRRKLERVWLEPQIVNIAIVGDKLE